MTTSIILGKIHPTILFQIQQKTIKRLGLKILAWLTLNIALYINPSGQWDLFLPNWAFREVQILLRLSPICFTIYGSMCTNQHQHNIALFHLHQHNTNNMLLTFFNNTQQQHNDMTQNVDIVGQQYIAINIVNVWLKGGLWIWWFSTFLHAGLN